MKEKEYKFRANVGLGNPEAELDKFLLDAFVSKDEYDFIRDTASDKTIILGRTGSGKSALIRKLKTEVSNYVDINPEALSLQHLSNSNIINFYKDLEINLDLFYKVLWRHVFIVEIIKIHFPDDDATRVEFFQSLLSRFKKDKAKSKALRYLKKWEEKFFENTEYQIKEIETNLETELRASIGGDFNISQFAKLAIGIDGAGKDVERKLIEVKHKAQSVVNNIQIDEVNEVMRLLQRDILPKTQRKYYILVDDLDKNWVDTRIVYDLIKALVEVIKEYSRIPQVKIVVALRTNIDNIVFSRNNVRGLQREKMKYLYLRLTWTPEELKTLINNRLKILMKEVYTNKSPTISDILPEFTKLKGDSFKYMVDRTLLRPRDLLDYFNTCIEYSVNKSKITWKTITGVEKRYSKGRLDALDDEWLENVGDLYSLYSVLKGQSKKFTLSDLHDHANSHFVNVIANGSTGDLNDKWKSLFDTFGKDYQPIPLLKEILALCHNVGILGIKISPEDSMTYVHETFQAIRGDEVSKTSPVFYVHPMYQRGLDIK